MSVGCYTENKVQDMLRPGEHGHVSVYNVEVVPKPDEDQVLYRYSFPLLPPLPGPLHCIYCMYKSLCSKTILI